MSRCIFTSAGNVELLSSIGEKMMRLAIAPELVVSLNRANELGCVGLMMALLAMLGECLECFLNPRNQEDKARYFNTHRQFYDDRRENWRLVRVLLWFGGDAERNLDGTYGRRWCETNCMKFSKHRAAI